MTGIIDYGAGNLHSVQNALNKLGEPSQITNNEQILNTCDRIILPGVGAFGDAMNAIKSKRLLPIIKKSIPQHPKHKHTPQQPKFTNDARNDCM